MRHRLPCITLATAGLLAMVGCAPGGHAGPPPGLPATRAQLVSHVWTLERAVDGQGASIAALFPPGAEGRLAFTAAKGQDHVSLSVDYGCNGQGGTRQLDAAGVLTPVPGDAGGWSSSLMLCPGLEDAEPAAARVLVAPMRATITKAPQPTLTLTTLDGRARTRWRGVPTDATRFGHAGVVLHLEVDPVPARCPAPAMRVQECLRVREVGPGYTLVTGRAGTPAPGPWFVLDTIARHAHDPARREVIVVRRFETPQGPHFVFEARSMSMAVNAPG